MPPCEIVPALADQGAYIASESTFYRVLRENKMQNHRGRSVEPQHRPIILLSDFKCLQGSDKKGYEFSMKNMFTEKTVNYQGKSLPAKCGISVDVSWFYFRCLWGTLCTYAKLFQHKNGFNNNYERLKWSLFQGLEIDEPLFKEKYLKETSFHEFAYEFFCLADLVQDYFEEIDAQYIADTVPVYPENGKMVRWYLWYPLLDTSDEKGIYEKKPVKADMVPDYVKSRQFLFRKTPMIVPFAVWRTSPTKGFSFLDIRSSVQVDWEK